MRWKKKKKMFKSIPQSERAYIALKEFYREYIIEAIQKHGLVVLSEKTKLNKSQFVNSIIRNSFTSMRRVAIKIEEKC
jgi:hypothetical protein